MEIENRDHQYKSVRRILWGVLIANLTITIIKITLGVVTGALAIVADGFHSLVDSSSNLIGLAAIRMAARPADKRYPYGYQRYETLGALAIGGLLLAVAWEIIQSIIDRINHGTQPEINWVTFGLMALTFPVNLGIVIYETRAGKRLNSDILLADATHTKTDLYVTGSVIASLIGIWLGWNWLDLVVATGVVGLIIRASIGILRDAAGSLADMIGIEPEQVEKIALSVPGVRYVHHVRSRGSSDAVFVDLHVKVDPAMTTSQAHAIASEVERRLHSGVKNIADAIVHIEPSPFEESSDWERISFGLRRIADGLGMGIHDLNVQVDLNGDYGIELDLEISGDITLGEAHQLADDFEARALKFWPQATSVTTHLEPLSNIMLYPSRPGDEILQVAVEDYLKSQSEEISVLGVQVLVLNDSKSLTIKLGMPASISLNASHLQVEEVKRKILSQFPEVSRVVVHVEPVMADQVFKSE
jgi:cation diffusion facilitator family transporter